MKKLLSIILLLLPVLLWAEDSIPSSVAAPARPNLMQEMAERVTFHQDSAITRLIQGQEGEMVEMKGFRVQVFSSNDQQNAKTNALGIEQKLTEAELQVEIHVQYAPPFWKVRVGDFRTIDEAQLMKEEIVRRFPELRGDTYVVRDQITVRK